MHKSRQALLAAAKLAPENSTNHLYLAETLLDLNEKDQAYQELHQVLKATTTANWAADLEEDRQKARQLLKQNNQTP